MSSVAVCFILWGLLDDGHLVDEALAVAELLYYEEHVAYVSFLLQNLKG